MSEVKHSGHKRAVTVPGIQGGRSILHMATDERTVGNNMAVVYSMKDIADNLQIVNTWIYSHYSGLEGLPIIFNYENQRREIDLETLEPILAAANDIILFCTDLLGLLDPQQGTRLVGVGSLAGGIIGENPDLDILVSGRTISRGIPDEFYSELARYRATLSHRFRGVDICYPSLW